MLRPSVARTSRGRHVSHRLEYERPKPFRYDGADFGDQILSRPRQFRIAMARHPLGSQHGRFDLVGGQHKRRQVQPRLQHIADAGLAPDWYSLADEVGDVAIDGPLGGPQFAGKCLGAYRFRRAPQDLNNLKEPVGGSHKPSLPNNADQHGGSRVAGARTIRNQIYSSAGDRSGGDRGQDDQHRIVKTRRISKACGGLSAQ